ncbi:adenylyl-sulfate kinase [Brevundimonas lenta]|uniref:Adenylyl-sulfate kinase n=1 Tax=Brevundimonas lenta TaxID=424796 RepID=A0A7W6JEH5_9CAUL|nr:adenylyl-sulfate kinase [Brevundimonas lenta]MBB4083631.1 bifunctional enzyme CysN/CysC [Brevundimonas lenta]
MLPVQSVVRLIACGSVDDGKSSLIGRLVHDTGAVPSDQLLALGPAPDLSLLVDGLAAEREQGITIDVAWRFLDVGGRRFILADTPGHEQYTRNMATAASTADAAIVLVDVRKGVLTQTRRHTRLLALLGVRRILLAVNKMDLADWSRPAFDAVTADYRAFAADLGLTDVTAVPISATLGDNLGAGSPHTPWHDGGTVVDWLRQAPTADAAPAPFRMPVQSAVRTDDFRGFQGRIVSGSIRPGDAVRVLPSAAPARIERIAAFDGDLEEARAGQSVTLTLDRPVDVSRGDLLACNEAPPEVADRFEAHLVWMSGRPLLPGRSYGLKLGSTTVAARVSDIRHRINVDTGDALAARTLELNDIGLVHLTLDAPVPFEPYEVSRDLGGFILIDRMTEETAGAGMIRFALRRSTTVRPQPIAIDRAERATQKGQRPLVVWFTGLSGAGKSTIANLVEQRLFADGVHSTLLDGDNIRRGLNSDLGFTDADRVENIRRVAEVVRLMTDAGLIVLAAFISPFRAERQMARELMAPGEFLEVHVDAPLDVVEARDIKGLYAQARSGGLANFTGIDSPYEPPEAPDLRIDAVADTPDQAADRVMALIRAALLR